MAENACWSSDGELVDQLNDDCSSGLSSRDEIPESKERIEK